MGLFVNGKNLLERIPIDGKGHNTSYFQVVLYNFYVEVKGRSPCRRERCFACLRASSGQNLLTYIDRRADEMGPRRKRVPPSHSIVHGGEKPAVRMGEEQGRDILIHIGLVSGEFDVGHGTGDFQTPLKGRL